MPNRDQITVALVFKTPMPTHALHLIEALAGMHSSAIADSAQCPACAEEEAQALRDERPDVWGLGHWYPLYTPDQDDQAPAATIFDATPTYWVYVFDDEDIAGETMELLEALSGYAIQGSPVFVQRENGLPETLFVGGTHRSVTEAMHRYYAGRWQEHIGEQSADEEMMLRCDLAELVTNLGADSPLVSDGGFADITDIRERAGEAGQLIY